MKGDTRRYTLKQISADYGIDIQTLKYRCVKNNLTPIVYNGLYQYALNINDVGLIIEKQNRYNVPEVVYVTRTTEIIHSKLNFLSLEQL